jgi:gamma-tubulin complex component 2
MDPDAEGFEPTIFIIDNTLDASLADLIKRILPMASNYMIVTHFIDTHSRFEFGKVNHALSAALRTLLQDYITLIAQIEHQIHFAPGFGLQKMWYHITPTLHLFELLAGLVQAVRTAESIGRDEAGDLSMNRSVIHELHGSSRGGGVLLGVLAEKMTTMSG